MFGRNTVIDFNELVNRGAQIIDVRTPAEFKNGHLAGSLNIPLSHISDDWAKINKNKPVIICCATGMRSASAKSILNSKGYRDVHNGGDWLRLQEQLKK